MVESGHWAFFGDTQFDDSYAGDPVFGPGIYPWVEAVGIQNDDIASLQPTTLAATFSNPNFESQFPPRLGPGLYPGVTQAGIASDQVSSLQPVKANPTTDGDILLAHIVLFTDADLRGPHKHVFVPEPNLNASDDDSFNDAVSSVASTWPAGSCQIPCPTRSA